MQPTIPQVHLLVCLDDRIAPGPILQVLDSIRTKFWQQEVVCLCDKNWQPFLGNEATVVCLDKESIYEDSSKSNLSSSLDALLTQLDDFDIQEVTIVGELKWGRWLHSYFDGRNVKVKREISIRKPQSSIETINTIMRALEIEPISLLKNSKKAHSVFVDPYCNGAISSKFICMLEGAAKGAVPNWMKIIFDSQDLQFFRKLGLKSELIERCEADVHLSVDPVLCFDEDSVYAQTSRSYRVAIFGEPAERAMFFAGDLQILTSTDIDLVEVVNIVNYWRADRLQELSFQWLSMGIDIHVVEMYQNSLSVRNLMSYSTDLDNCQHILELFKERRGVIKPRDLNLILQDIRRANQHNPYSISFSFKFLILIVERMILSLKAGERLFQRLGSDHHRILVAEAIFENLYDQKVPINSNQCIKKLVLFLDFLIRVDDENDQLHFAGSGKESA